MVYGEKIPIPSCVLLFPSLLTLVAQTSLAHLLEQFALFFISRTLTAEKTDAVVDISEVFGLDWSAITEPFLNFPPHILWRR